MTALHNVTAARRGIDSICEKFESAWRSGAELTVEEMLAEAPRSISIAELTQELIAIEVELRCEQGSMPSVDEYLARFPEWTGWIDLLARVGTPTEALAASSPHERSHKVNGRAQEFEIPGYRIVEEIGRGGMGTVYKAVDLRLGRCVALKVIRDSDCPASFDAQRFRREATTIALLQHPGIVQVFSVDEHAGHSFLVLELIEGQSLQELIRESSVDPVWAVTLMVRLARVVHYAHRRGVIHRDLKPANILLKSKSESVDPIDPTTRFDHHLLPVPVITDFGLAKRLFADETISGNGALFGTPSYMPPEQAQGRSFEATPASDVYSLGAVFYELLTGQPPFEGDSHLETIRLVCRKQPTPVRVICPEIPTELERICLRCLEKDPCDRYPSAAALADDLQACLSGENGMNRVRAPMPTRTTFRTCVMTAIAVATIVLTGLIGYAIGAGS